MDNSEVPEVYLWQLVRPLRRWCLGLGVSVAMLMLAVSDRMYVNAMVFAVTATICFVEVKRTTDRLMLLAQVAPLDENHPRGPR